MPNYADIPQFSQYIEYVTQGDLVDNTWSVVINPIQITDLDLENADVAGILDDCRKIANLPDRATDLVTMAAQVAITPVLIGGRRQPSPMDAALSDDVLAKANEWLTNNNLDTLDSGASYSDLMGEIGG